jgi:hypothetical protein
MLLPKLIAVAVCAGVLGAQLALAIPPAPDRSWYWPFLPYPMYSKAHASSDTLIVPQLRVRACGDSSHEVILDANTLGAPLHHLTALLTTIARAPGSDSASDAQGRLGRAIEAEFPARYCAASAWARTVRVDDPSTYDLHNAMHRVAVWDVNRTDSK